MTRAVGRSVDARCTHARARLTPCCPHAVPHACRKVWLREVGSPKSVITGAAFTNQRVVESYSFENFQVRR